MRNVYHLLAWGELSGEAGAAHDKVALVPRRRAPGTEVGYLGPGPSPFPFCNVIPHSHFRSFQDSHRSRSRDLSVSPSFCSSRGRVSFPLGNRSMCVCARRAALVLLDLQHPDQGCSNILQVLDEKTEVQILKN